MKVIFNPHLKHYLKQKCDGFGWRSSGENSRFLLESNHSKFPPGWYRFDIKIAFREGPPPSPKLLLVGEGNTGEGNSLTLPMPRNGLIRYITYFSSPVEKIFFYPSTGGDAEFRLEKIQAKRLSRPLALLEMVTPAITEIVGKPGHFFHTSLRILRTEGLAAFKDAIVDKYRIINGGAISGGGATVAEYTEWVKKYDILAESDRAEILSHIRTWDRPPLFSLIMPVFNTPGNYLRDAIESVRNQLYSNWELCIADDASTAGHIRALLQEYASIDARIKVVFREENGHISEASNSALDLASGNFIALLDHDDELPEHALYMVANEIINFPDADIIYSDEDKIDEKGERFDPHFKSDWNPESFLFPKLHFPSWGISRISCEGGWRIQERL